MDDGAPDGDATEGREVSDDDEITVKVVEGWTAPNRPLPRSRSTKMQRTAKWKRTITITGPAEWVLNTRNSSLAQGVHLVGTIDGVPCTIEVEAEDMESQRFLHSTVPNGLIAELRVKDPAAYEAIHGHGTAREHADWGDEQVKKRPSSSATHTTPTIPADGHFGQYL